MIKLDNDDSADAFLKYVAIPAAIAGLLMVAIMASPIICFLIAITN